MAAEHMNTQDAPLELKNSQSEEAADSRIRSLEIKYVHILQSEKYFIQLLH